MLAAALVAAACATAPTRPDTAPRAQVDAAKLAVFHCLFDVVELFDAAVSDALMADAARAACAPELDAYIALATQGYSEAYAQSFAETTRAHSFEDFVRWARERQR